MPLQNMAPLAHCALKHSFQQEILGKLPNLSQIASLFIKLLVLPTLPQPQIHQEYVRVTSNST